MASPPMQGGVNLAGLDFGTAMPGTLNVDYVQPTAAELTYYHDKGLNVVRLPVRWERLQPLLLASKPSGRLDPAYTALIVQVLHWAAERHMTVIIDVHNYGAYGSHKLGDGVLGIGLFRRFWTGLATKLGREPGLFGFDLMNEPNGLPSPATWPQFAQAAVDGIRSVDTGHAIFVEGYFYASAIDWLTYNAGLSIFDSAHNLFYEAHVYGDRDNSGTHTDWTTETGYGVTTNTIAQRVNVFTGWCKLRSVRCVFGEVGVPNNDPNWNVELANGLAAMQAGGIAAVTYWAGGPWWGNYTYSLEPTAAGDAVQMPVVDRYGLSLAASGL